MASQQLHKTVSMIRLKRSVVLTTIWTVVIGGIRICRQWRRRHPQLMNFVVVGIIFGLFWARCFELLDPDFGWHLTAGNYIRQHWLPAHDIYTYTARNYRWIDHEWGNDVIVSWLYQLGGYGLLSTVFAGLWTASLCLFRNRLRLGILVLAALAVMPYAGIRPVVWTVLCLALLLELIGRGTKRAMLAIPLLILIWTNLHGGFSLGLAVITYYGLVRRRLSWLWLLLICILVTFINPYGPRLYVEVANTLFDPSLHSHIAEWNSFNIHAVGIAFIMVWAIGFGLFDKTKLRAYFSLPILLIIASLSATRNLPLFVVAALRDTDRYARLFPVMKRLDWSRQLIIALGIATAIGLLGFWAYNQFLPWQNRESLYPKQAVAYLQEHPCAGNLFNDYNYGGYLIWKLPGKPVYIDGRMPSWRKPGGGSYIDTYYDVIDKPAVRQAQFARYNIRCALLQTNSSSPFVDGLKQQGWHIVSNVNNIILLVAPS